MLFHNIGWLALGLSTLAASTLSARLPLHATRQIAENATVGVQITGDMQYSVNITLGGTEYAVTIDTGR